MSHDTKLREVTPRQLAERYYQQNPTEARPEMNWSDLDTIFKNWLDRLDNEPERALAVAGSWCGKVTKAYLSLRGIKAKTKKAMMEAIAVDKSPKCKDSLDREEGQPTPGTWSVGEINHAKHHAYVRAERKYPGSVCVAEVRCETIMDDELEANARLVAAAPELLEALRDIGGLADMGDVSDGAELHAALSDILERATAAIAKAQGGAS